MLEDGAGWDVNIKSQLSRYTHILLNVLWIGTCITEPSNNEALSQEGGRRITPLTQHGTSITPRTDVDSMGMPCSTGVQNGSWQHYFLITCFFESYVRRY
ncbi:hypothetical protein N7513_005111 [Penicillium frequentans]|nr:hypothetical protein N7513_005111 [Penicillium glabrum]